MRSKLILFLMLIGSLVYGQTTSTGTYKPPNIIPKTTSQILLNDCIDKIVTNTQKLATINELLNSSVYYQNMVGVAIDTTTGQDLTNLKTNIEREIHNQKIGRNYSAGITYPVFKKGK